MSACEDCGHGQVQHRLSGGPCTAAVAPGGFVCSCPAFVPPAHGPGRRQCDYYFREPGERGGTTTWYCLREFGHAGDHENSGCTPPSWSAASDSEPAGRKDDAGKLRYTLLPWKALDEVVRVLEHGAAKYGQENWREVPEARERYLNAAMRHVVAIIAGSKSTDADSGHHHLAHAVCSLLFVLTLEIES